MNKIVLGNEWYNIPGCWDELSRVQLIRIAEQLMPSMSTREAMKRVSFILLGLKNNLKLFRFFTKCSAEDRIEADMLAAFIFEKKELTKDILQYVPVGFFTNLYGPGDNFRHVSFIDFIKANAYLTNYQKTKDEHWLNMLVATLYRPKKWFWNIRIHLGDDSDMRVRFTDNRTALYAKKLKKTPIYYKIPVVWYFIGCMENIVRKNPDVFPEEEQRNSSGDSWADALISLSGTKFGDLEKTSTVNFHVIIRNLKLIAKQNK